ncbi:MAG: hypothetical protein C5B50_03105 [Verrucomicrobia bacterium]|nr:MAG: hypothetical protein C5B50_03105 [Verrucomicrobiota bacterium]
MPGFRVRINDLPEQPGERKISQHWFFLLIGLVLLAMGLKGLRDYVTLKGPPLAELHQLKLADVTNVVVVPEIPGSARIDNIWLQTLEGAKIRYRNRFPYFEEIRRLNPDYGLLLDETNRVWGITKRSGEILDRNYFEEYNIEAKSVGKICGSFFAISGFVLLFLFVQWERLSRAGKLTPQSLATAPQILRPVRLRQIMLWGAIIAYAIFCVTVIFPLLAGKGPVWMVPLIWVLGCGVIGNGIVAYFRKHPPKGS